MRGSCIPTGCPQRFSDSPLQLVIKFPIVLRALQAASDGSTTLHLPTYESDELFQCRSAVTCTAAARVSSTPRCTAMLRGSTLCSLDQFLDSRGPTRYLPSMRLFLPKECARSSIIIPSYMSRSFHHLTTLHHLIISPYNIKCE